MVANMLKNAISITEKEFFKKFFNFFVEMLLIIFVKKLKSICFIDFSVDTEVFVVSSSQDVHSTFVYPTAPYVQSGQSVPHKNVTFLPDPCIIKLNGVTIGMTATDIYSHISDAEIAV